MKYQKFLNEIERELELRMLEKGETPILDRLQIHIDNLDNKDYGLDTLLNPNNIKHELYVSMLYQIVYPAKSKNIFTITYEGQEIEGKNDREKIQNLAIKIGADDIKKLKTYSKFLYKKNIGEVVGNAYKIIDKNHSFDTSFGGVGASSVGRYFVKELKNTLKLNIEFTYEKTFSYN